MTKNERMIKKAIGQLHTAQKRATARIYTEKELLYFIEQAKNAMLKDQDAIKYKKYLQGVNFYHKQNVPNAYKYWADTTIISGRINKYGNIERIDVYRGNADRKAYGYNDNDIELLFT